MFMPETLQKFHHNDIGGYNAAPRHFPFQNAGMRRNYVS
jgi:hypothetical protein